MHYYVQYINFMRMYENQREKAEKEIERYEREMDRVSKRVVELESQNFALQKGINIGSMCSKDSEVGSYMDQILIQKSQELESQNQKLTTALQTLQTDFKDILSEVERLRHQVQERDKHI